MKCLKHIPLLLSAILFMSSCAGYRLGNTLPEGVETVTVPTFINQTTEPLIEVAATDATIAQFQFDGSLRISKKENADAILEARLLNYRLVPISFEQDDQKTATQYRAILSAAIVLRRISDNSVIAESPNIEGDYTFDFTGDMTTSKNTALPEASKDLARKIVDACIEVW